MIGSNASLIYGIENFTIGSGSVSYKVDKYTPATDNLVVKVGNVTIATRSNVTGSSVNELTRTITFSAAELTKIYNAMSKVTKATFLFTITSYVDGANIGSTSTTTIGTLPTSMKPNLTKVTLTESITDIANKFGEFVKQRTRLKYAYTFTLATGSSISSYNLTIDGTSYSGATGTTNTIKTSGTVNYSAYVVDSRGRKSNVVTGSINVLEYTSPKITTFNVIRCNADGTENSEGSYAKYSVNASISPINNKNNKLFVIDYKKQEDSAWTTWKTYNAGYTLNETSSVLKIDDVAYHFRITATDYFTNPNKIYPLSSTYLLFEITEDLDGIALGKIATEKDTFDIGFSKTNLSRTTYVGGKADSNEKNLYFPNPTDGQYPHNSKVYGGNSTSPVAIGMYDSLKGLPIFQYFDGEEYRLKFGDDIVLRWGNYDVEATMVKVVENLTGRIHYKNGLLIQWGTISIAGGAGEPTSATVTYPIAYDFIPYVGVSVVSTVVGTIVTGVGHGSDSITKTDVYVNRINTANTSIRWVTIGFKEI